MIGDKIKQIRKQAGLTQKELAEQLGTTQQNLAQYESGKRNPKIETIEKIANALDVPVSYLIGNKEKTIIEESRQQTAFLNYLDNLGYEYIDGNWYDSEPEEVGILHIKKENIDIPITKYDFDRLEQSIENNVELEIYRLRKDKGL